MLVESVAVQIREEQSTDHALIHRLTEIAFASAQISGGTEPQIINRLRASNKLALSLVAEDARGIQGHVAFSPVQIGQFSTGWFGLGPVSVHPHEQRKGIGSLLITQGLEKLRIRNADGCALIGDPDYYHRFGFRSDGKLQYADVPSEYVQWISFGNKRPAGDLIYSSAFDI